MGIDKLLADQVESSSALAQSEEPSVAHLSLNCFRVPAVRFLHCLNCLYLYSLLLGPAACLHFLIKSAVNYRYGVKTILYRCPKRAVL